MVDGLRQACIAGLLNEVDNSLVYAIDVHVLRHAYLTCRVTVTSTLDDPYAGMCGVFIAKTTFNQVHTGLDVPIVVDVEVDDRHLPCPMRGSILLVSLRRSFVMYMALQIQRYDGIPQSTSAFHASGEQSPNAQNTTVVAVPLSLSWY